jgi:hypothetical protein
MEIDTGFVKRTYRTMSWVGPLVALYCYHWFGGEAMLGIAAGVAVALISLSSIQVNVLTTTGPAVSPLLQVVGRLVKKVKWLGILGLMMAVILSKSGTIVFGFVGGFVLLHAVMLIKALTLALTPHGWGEAQEG